MPIRRRMACPRVRTTFGEPSRGGIQNGGVDFAKGCYVGQSLFSRMQHRGRRGNAFSFP